MFALWASSLKETMSSTFWLSFKPFQTEQGPGSRKTSATFRAREATFLVICVLKTETCIGLKLCMKGTSVYIKNMGIKQLCNYGSKLA